MNAFLFCMMLFCYAKKCNFQPLAAVISFFTHQQITFFTNFLNFIQSEKKIFIINFPFLKDSLKPLAPLLANSQNLLCLWP